MPEKLELSRRAFLRRLLALPAAGVAMGLSSCGAPANTPAPAPTARAGSAAQVPRQAPTQAPAPVASAPAVAQPPATAAAPAAPTAAAAPSAMTAATTTTLAPSATAAATSVPVSVAPAGSGGAYLVVVRGKAPGAAELTRLAIAALGGIERYVKSGADVIVKPNICNAYNGPEYASTTNPEVVAAIVALCLGAGAKRVRVMDNPFGGTAQNAYTKSGIARAVEAAGGQMELMSSLKYQAVAIPNGQRMKNTEVYGDILKADVLINVPIAKHHSAATLTMGLKNLMGVVRNRQGVHAAGLPQGIADLATIIKPALTVIDATRILMANGPTGGNLNDVKRMDTIIASADMVATDAYGATLFGKTAADIAYIPLAEKLRVGKMDLKSIKIEEISA